jgi:hypothetical protein
VVFKKGQTGNPNGRPKKKVDPTKPFNEDLFKRLLDAANGDGVVLTKLSLQNAMELGDIPDWAMKYFKLAEKVNNFQHAKKASIETRIDDFRRIEFHMINQDIYGDIEQIHKKDPALIDKIVEAEFTEIVNGEKNALEVVEQHLTQKKED